MVVKKVECPVCGAPMKKGKNKIPLKDNKGEIKRIVHGYVCARCGYRKIG